MIPAVSFPDVVGVLGVGCVLLAQLQLQRDHWRQDGLRYWQVNALGAAAILFSLYFDFNLASALMEGTWLTISLVGLYQRFRSRSLRSQGVHGVDTGGPTGGQEAGEHNDHQ